MLSSVLMTILSATMTHVSVRRVSGYGRAWLLCIAGLLLVGAILVGSIPGGLWAAVFTVVSLYFLACMTTPWVEMLWRLRRAA